MLDDTAAREVYQTFLDDNGVALIESDFERYRRDMALPFTLETLNERTVLTTEEEVMKLFADTRHCLDVAGIEGITRECIAASCPAKGMIRGHHRAWLVDRSGTLRDSYSGLLVFYFVDGRWVTSHAQYDCASKALPNRVMTRKRVIERRSLG